MMRSSAFRKFRKNDDGAVTVDWVVITAAIITICVGMFAIIGPAVITYATGLKADMAQARMK